MSWMTMGDVTRQPTGNSLQGQEPFSLRWADLKPWQTTNNIGASITSSGFFFFIINQHASRQFCYRTSVAAIKELEAPPDTDANANDANSDYRAAAGAGTGGGARKMAPREKTPPQERLFPQHEHVPTRHMSSWSIFLVSTSRITANTEHLKYKCTSCLRYLLRWNAKSQFYRSIPVKERVHGHIHKDGSGFCLK